MIDCPYMVVFQSGAPDTLTSALVMPHHEKNVTLASNKRFPSHNVARAYAVQLARCHNLKLGFERQRHILDEALEDEGYPKLFSWTAAEQVDGYPARFIAVATNITWAREIVRQQFQQTQAVDADRLAMLERDIARHPDVLCSGALMLAA